MPLLTIADHDAIRGAIDGKLTSRDLSDQLIASAIYRPASSSEVESRVPDWSTRPDTEREAARRAAIYLCAAKLCPVAPVMQSETISRWSGSRAEGLDLEARARELRSLAEAEIRALLTGSGAAVAPLMFTTARGRRYT